MIKMFEELPFLSLSSPIEDNKQQYNCSGPCLLHLNIMALNISTIVSYHLYRSHGFKLSIHYSSFIYIVDSVRFVVPKKDILKVAIVPFKHCPAVVTII